jgi:hypothetical protein
MRFIDAKIRNAAMAARIAGNQARAVTYPVKQDNQDHSTIYAA